VTTRELREQAAAYLLTHGWTQGQLRDGMGRCCAIGVVYRVAGPDREALAAQVLHDLHVELRAKHGSSSLAFWNDRFDRTVEQVVALLRGTT
jgi:hypothetical protein